MLNPLKWKYEDRLRLLFATVFGALLGFTNGYSHGWFNILWALVGAVVMVGRSIVIGLFGSCSRPPGGLLLSATTPANVRLWHKAGMPVVVTYVR